MNSMIDQLYVGTLDVDRVNIKFDHIKDRSILNRFSIDYIKNLLFNEEMMDYEYIGDIVGEGGYDIVIAHGSEFHHVEDVDEYTRVRKCGAQPFMINKS